MYLALGLLLALIALSLLVIILFVRSLSVMPPPSVGENSFVHSITSGETLKLAYVDKKEQAPNISINKITLDSNTPRDWLLDKTRYTFELQDEAGQYNIKGRLLRNGKIQLFIKGKGTGLLDKAWSRCRVTNDTVLRSELDKALLEQRQASLKPVVEWLIKNDNDGMNNLITDIKSKSKNNIITTVKGYFSNSDQSLNGLDQILKENHVSEGSLPALLMERYENFDSIKGMQDIVADREESLVANKVYKV